SYPHVPSFPTRRSSDLRKTILALALSAKLVRSLSPLPPTPIPAIYNVSLGATKPFPPSTKRGTMVNAVAATPACRRKLRRDRADDFFCSFIFVTVLNLRCQI